MSQARIDAFLQLGREQNASDIHLAVGMPPVLRMHGWWRSRSMCPCRSKTPGASRSPKTSA